MGKHDSFISAVAFSPDRSLVASGGADLAVKIWETSGKNELITVRGYTDSVSPFIFGKNNDLITVNGSVAHVWNLKKGIKRPGAPIHTGTVTNIILNPQETLMASSDQTTLNVEQWAGMYDPKRPADYGKWIKRQHSDKVIRIWETEKGRRKKSLVSNTKDPERDNISYDI